MLARALPGVPVLVGADRYLSGRLRRAAARRDRPPAGRWVSASGAGARRRSAARWTKTTCATACCRPAGCASRSRPRRAPTRSWSPPNGHGLSDRVRSVVGSRTGVRVRTVARTRRVGSATRRAGSTRSGDGRCCAVAGIARPERFFERSASRRVDGRRHDGLPRSPSFRARRRAAHRERRSRRRAPTRCSRPRRMPCGSRRLAAGGPAAWPSSRSTVTSPSATFADWLRRSASRRTATKRYRASANHESSASNTWPCKTADRARPNALPRRSWSSTGALVGLGCRFVFDRAHRRIAERNVAAAFPARSAGRAAPIVRGAFAHFGRLLFELLKFSTLSPEAMLARVEFEGEERVRAGVRAGQGRAVRDRPFRLLGAAGDGPRAAAPADGRAGARARQPRR